MSEEDHRQDIEDLIAELKRREVAAKLLGQQLAQRIEERTQLIAGLNTALLLIEQLVTDMRYAGVMPTATTMIAKGNLDANMKKLLGDERVVRQSRDEQ
jgi:sensor domain CHASE-containing protein